MQTIPLPLSEALMGMFLFLSKRGIIAATFGSDNKMFSPKTHKSIRAKIRTFPSLSQTNDIIDKKTYNEKHISFTQ